MKKRDNLEDVSIDGKAILEFILNKLVVGHSMAQWAVVNTVMNLRLQ
jgi:hypothetical protein